MQIIPQLQGSIVNNLSQPGTFVVSNPQGHCYWVSGQYFAHGAFGLVYNAIDEKGEHCVLKMQNVAGNETGLSRWLNEAAIGLMVCHKNILQTRDCFVICDQQFACLVMEPAVGSLGDLIAEKKWLSPIQVCRVGIQILEALECFHAKDLIHRDVKPGNLLISSEGTVKIADFGISKHVGATGYSRSSTICLKFAPPEYLVDGKTSFKADLYQLGLTLLLLTGNDPFLGVDDDWTIGHRIRSGAPRQMAESIARQFPEWSLVATCIEVMLRLDPRSRYSSEQTAREALQTAMNLLVAGKN